MTSPFLTNTTKVKGHIMDFFEERLTEHISQHPDLDDSFKFVRHYNTHADKKFSNWVGVYKKGTNTYVVKHLTYKFKNLKYYQLRHEADILRSLSNISPQVINGYQICFPKLYSFIEKNNSITLIRTHLDGKSIKSFSPQEQTKFLDIYLKGMKKISIQQFSFQDSSLPKNRYASLFLVYVIQSIIKDWKHIRTYLTLSYRFYRSYFQQKKSDRVCFAHRDLHKDNILIDGNTINVIDLEVSEVTKEETDLAIIARYYVSSLGLRQMTKLIKNNLTTSNMYSNFTFLTIFYAIQLIANESINDFYRNQAYEYLIIFLQSFANIV